MSMSHQQYIADLLRCGTHNSDVETVKCVLGFCYNCPSEKVSQKFLRISVEKMRDFFFFALKKSLSGTETWPDAFLPDKGVFHFRLLFLAMSRRYASVLDDIAEYLPFISSAQSFWFTLNMSYRHGCHLAS
jgi:hypothetical protein